MKKGPPHVSLSCCIKLSESFINNGQHNHRLKISSSKYGMVYICFLHITSILTVCTFKAAACISPMTIHLLFLDPSKDLTPIFGS